MSALPQPIPKMTETEYLEFERTSDVKHEYRHGEIFDMAGASRKHNLISANLVRIIGNQLLEKPCGVYSADMRVKVDTKAYTYPDVVAVCGEIEFADNVFDTLLNPTVIIEILSPSTALIDHNEKLHEYIQIGSLQEYVLVSQNQARIERYLRQDSGDWLYTQIMDLQGSIKLPSIACKLALSDVYKKVTFGGEEGVDES